MIKYDLRSMIRRFVPLWVGLAVLSVLNGFTIRYVLEGGQFKGTMLFLLGIMPLVLLVVLWMAVAVLTLTYICERFYKGLLGDEGYLMLTLPVTTGEHIAAKTVTALILEIGTGIVGLLSWGLLMMAYHPEWLDVVREYWREFLGVFSRAPGWFWIELLVLALVSTVANTLQIYAAISLGHLAKRHRAGMAFVAYIVINMVLSTLMTLLIPLMDKFPSSWYYYIDQFGLHGMSWVAFIALAVTILWQTLKGGAFFLVSNYILKNRLNLE